MALVLGKMKLPKKASSKRASGGVAKRRKTSKTSRVSGAINKLTGRTKKTTSTPKSKGGVAPRKRRGTTTQNSARPTISRVQKPAKGAVKKKPLTTARKTRSSRGMGRTARKLASKFIGRRRNRR